MIKLIQLNDKNEKLSTMTYFIDFQADGGVACCPHRVDGKLVRGILQLDGENRIDAGVRVLYLHVEVGKGSAVGHILGDGDLVGFKGG